MEVLNYSRIIGLSIYSRVKYNNNVITIMLLLRERCTHNWRSCWTIVESRVSGQLWIKNGENDERVFPLSSDFARESYNAIQSEQDDVELIATFHQPFCEIPSLVHGDDDIIRRVTE